jgi:hypothetical protein
LQHYYQLVTSRSQLLINLAAHFIAAATIFFFVVPGLLKWSGIAAMALSARSGYRHLIRHEIIRLRVDAPRQAVLLQQAGQSYFYCKYKVYQTRWFAILRLVDQQTQRTLILNSDCFQSVECYRQLRFDLRQLERSDAA